MILTINLRYLRSGKWVDVPIWDGPLAPIPAVGTKVSCDAGYFTISEVAFRYQPNRVDLELTAEYA